jgi:hypothetical protein
MGLKIEFATEEKSVRKKAMSPTPDFMALVKNKLLGRRRRGYQSTIILFNPKTFVTLQASREAAFGEGRRLHDSNLPTRLRQL